MRNRKVRAQAMLWHPGFVHAGLMPMLVGVCISCWSADGPLVVAVVLPISKEALEAQVALQVGWFVSLCSGSFKIWVTCSKALFLWTHFFLRYDCEHRNQLGLAGEMRSRSRQCDLRRHSWTNWSHGQVAGHFPHIPWWPTESRHRDFVVSGHVTFKAFAGVCDWGFVHAAPMLMLAGAWILYCVAKIVISQRVQGSTFPRVWAKS